MDSGLRAYKYLWYALVLGAWIVALATHSSFPDVSPALTLAVRQDAAGVPSPESILSELDLRTNAQDYPDGEIPRYDKFEASFVLTDTTATNPYFPYDANTPPGVESASGITVDALFLPPGHTGWQDAMLLPCFYYQPVEEVGEGDQAALLPVGDAEWRCRFTPQTPGVWTYKIQVVDAGGSYESGEHQFACVQSDKPGFVGVGQADPRFFEFSDGTPFLTPLVNLEQGNPFNGLAKIRRNTQYLGDNGVRFVRWFPTGEGANYFVAPFADNMRINWAFGAGSVTADDADVGAGKLFSFAPYYYSSQSIPIVPESRYRLSFRAKVTGERVLRPQLGSLSGGSIDICSSTSTYHESVGQTCTYKQDGWQDYSIEVETTDFSPAALSVAVRGLYVSSDASAPYSSTQEGSIRVHSIQLQRDETGDGGWGPNLLVRSDPDTYQYVDQRAAARLDEILRLSEQYGVYHKLTLFHKNDAILARFQPDGTIGDWGVDNFYSDEGQASRWYQEAYVRYFVARWSYSPALHSLELANENNFDDKAQDAGFDVAEYILQLSPRHILMSNSFWGWWVESFWTDPVRGHLMDYSDKHWYANPDGASCDAKGNNCELISNIWTDSAAYVRECWHRFREYSQYYDYDRSIVRGEGGVAQSGTAPQHPDIRKDPLGTYYHKKLWAHLGVLGYSCDGEWYPRLFVPYDDAFFPNSEHHLGGMFAAYEWFLAGEPLANGRYVEIGTDLAGSEQVALSDMVGHLRAWGVRDSVSGRTFLWIDNADHTWKSVVDESPIAEASATVKVPGFMAGMVCQVQWWDPYAADPANQVLYVESIAAQADGSIPLAVDDLATDVTVKILPPPVYKGYLPLILKLD